MANTANSTKSTLTTDFNVTPYYDDYSPDKDFYRILFKPGYAVQARELTQIQSMLQAQIYRFGRNIFKEGSIVLPGAFTFQMNVGEKKGNPVNFVKIKNTDGSGNVINVASYLNQTIVGNTSNIKASVSYVLDTDGTTTNTKTLYVTYLSASPLDPTIRTFLPNETLFVANVGTVIVSNTDPVANVGYASSFKIDEGVYFAKDHFISFPTQTVILDRYNPNPTCKVGFYVTEEIVSSSQDSSLLDPALEASNYSAPGADRLSLVSTLTVVPYDFTSDSNFVTLFTVKNGVVQISNEKSQYNVLGDAMAKRTSDESGDYVIKGFNVQISEHKNSGSNYGRYTTGNTGSLVVGVDSGYGYVKGYAVNNNDRFEVEILKPNNFNNVTSQITSTTMGQYVTVNEFVGTWIADQGQSVSLYDQVNRRITNNGVTTSQKWSTGSQSGNTIGTAIVNAIEYSSGTPGYDAKYNIYLSDIKMIGSNTFSNVRSLYYNHASAADMGADIVGANNTTSNTAIISQGQAPLLYYVGSNATKSVRSKDGTTATTYFFNRTSGVSSSVLIGTSGNTSITITGPTNEILPYGTATVSDTDVSQDIIMTFNQTINVGPLWSGTSVVSSGGGTNTLTGVNTYFSRLNIGDKIEIQGLANTYYVTAIADDTHLTVSNTVPASVTANVIYKAYKTGDQINLIGKGSNTGIKRVVTATPTSLFIDLKEAFSTQVAATVNYKMASTASTEAEKLLNPKRYVIINCATAGTNGPFCLGFSDVYQVRKIVKKTGSAPTSLTDGTDVTKYFTLDNGQRDTLYDLANIVKSSGLTLGATDRLLVYLDYFVPNFSGKSGYFSINSYPIDDVTSPTPDNKIRTENVPVYTSPITSLTYDLRNQIDFRPVKIATALDATSVAGASTNPSNTSTYNFSATYGMRFPVPSTELTYNYSYYLGRKDIVVVNKDGTIAVTPGVPADFPVVPDSLDTQMLLTILSIAPYPSLSPAYANVLGRKDLSCSAQKVSVRGYTMRDIGVLDKRIKNLEYYTSLTLLEKDALNMKILDANGLDRFKNGIFIDTFKDTSLTAKGIDPDFRIVTDPIELAIRPLFSTDSFAYTYISGSNVALNDNKVTMAYTEVLQFSQPHATDFRNLERGSYYFQGTLILTPQQDIWVDTSFAPDEVVKITANGATLAISDSLQTDVDAQIKKSYLNTTWEGWKTTITGYNLYRGQGASKQFIGFFTTEAAAKQQAAQWTTAPAPGHATDLWNATAGDAATLETVFNNTRKGTNWFANESTDSVAGANKLISSEVIPYIRPQEIVGKATGLKPYSYLNVFFDGVNVTQYVTPLTASQYATALAKLPLPLTGVAAQGSDMIVGTDGNVYFILKLPADNPKFRTGERKIILMDGSQVDPQNPNDEEDASTIASAYFFADGTKQTLQRTVYSTDGYRKTGEDTSESNTSYANQILPNTFSPPPKPKTGHCCFNPEAKVLMADLTWKAICEVAEGDQVIGDNGKVNTVLRSNKVNVGDRKMIQFKGHDFFTTDDHLFLTKKGWKTWDPEHVLNDTNTINKEFLIGENRTTPINSDDLLKIFNVDDSNLVEEFVPIEFEAHDFDPEYVVYDLNTDGNKTYIVDGFVAHNCCVAYTYLVKAPEDEEGIFVTGYDVFVQRKSATRGMWFEIREMDAAGQITDRTIPGSEVHYDNADIKVSANGKANATYVKFDAPVFLFNNKPYAFVVHSFDPGGLVVDPDTAIWISRLGETDKNTGVVVSDRQKLGDFFQTTNNKQWDVIPDIDLTINIYRANFNVGTGSFIIGNQPVEKFRLANVSSSLTSRIGDHFISGDILTTTAANGSGFAVGDILRGVTSGAAANGTIVSIPGTNQVAMSNTRYQIGELVNAYYASNGVYKQASATVTAIANNTAQLSYYDEGSANIYAEFISSTGGFIANAVIQSVRESGYQYRGQIARISDFTYSSVSFEPNVLDFIKTNISYEMLTYANGSITAGNYGVIHPSETYYFPEEKVVYSRTNELANLGGSTSNRVRVTFDNLSQYVSPLFDLKSSHTIYIDNLINANTDGETGKSGGQAINKYISQTITLADGQDAEDINVFLTAYRPPTTDVKVYIKILNKQDPDPMSQKYWIELVKQGDGDITYSSIADRNNFKEFQFSFSTSIKTGSMSEVQYTSGGVTYTGYKYFAVKIVLTATNPAVVPRVADLRCIALQM